MAMISERISLLVTFMIIKLQIQNTVKSLTSFDVSIFCSESQIISLAKTWLTTIVLKGTEK